jgi:uncharacterized cupin superfamily protein
MNERLPSRSQPVAIEAAAAAPRRQLSSYPEPFVARMTGREKRPLGDVFGLSNFGVNLTRLAPGAISALRHAHSRQDEFVYILDGEPTLVTDAGETVLRPGMRAGFKVGAGKAHHLVNRSEQAVVYLEVGDRSARDVVTDPDDDIVAVKVSDGRWRYVRKGGAPSIGRLNG